MKTEQSLETTQDTVHPESSETKQQRFLIVGAKIFEVYEDTSNWKISPLP